MKSELGNYLEIFSFNLINLEVFTSQVIQVQTLKFQFVHSIIQSSVGKFTLSNRF